MRGREGEGVIGRKMKDKERGRWREWEKMKKTKREEEGEGVIG